MKRLMWLILLIHVYLVPQVGAQSCQKLFLSGKFVDTTRSIIMPSIQFTSTRTANEIKIKENGLFSGLVKQNEIIEFYFEDYESIRFIALTKGNSCTMDTTLYLQPKLNL